MGSYRLLGPRTVGFMFLLFLYFDKPCAFFPFSVFLPNRFVITGKCTTGKSLLLSNTICFVIPGIFLCYFLSKTICHQLLYKMFDIE